MNFQKLRSVTDSVKIADRANNDVKDKIYSMLERSTYKWLQTHSVPDDALEAEDIVNELYAQMSKVGKDKDESYLDYLAHSGKSDAELGAQVKAFVSRRAQDILSVATKHPVVHASEDYDDDEGGLTIDRAAGPSTEDSDYVPSQAFIDLMGDPNNKPYIERALSRMDPSDRSQHINWYYNTGRNEYSDQPDLISNIDELFSPYRMKATEKSREKVKNNPLTPDIKSQISNAVPGAVSVYKASGGRKDNYMIQVTTPEKLGQDQIDKVTEILEPINFSYYSQRGTSIYYKPVIATADSFDTSRLTQALRSLGIVTDSVNVSNGRLSISAYIFDSDTEDLIYLANTYGR